MCAWHAARLNACLRAINPIVSGCRRAPPHNCKNNAVSNAIAATSEPTRRDCGFTLLTVASRAPAQAQTRIHRPERDSVRVCDTVRKWVGGWGVLWRRARLQSTGI